MSEPAAFVTDADSEKRRDLFWKQIEQAAKDVAAWPDYLKRAFGVKS